MKRFLAGVLVGVLISAAPVAAASTIRLIVNGQEVVSDVPPQMIGGRVMVPVRFVSEALGSNVAWDSASQTVTITGGGLPRDLSCELLDAIKTMAEEVQMLYKGLEIISDIALDHVSGSQAQNIRDLLKNGKVLNDHAAQVEAQGKQVIPQYCGQ